MRRWTRVLGTLAFLASGVAAGAGGRHEADGGKARLDLRATPRMAFSPAQVFLVAELKGQPGEEYYCPGLEWEWGDGSTSAEEGDCPPWQDGAEVERFYSARHAYGSPGSYDVKITLRRAQRTLAVATIEVVVMGASAP